MGVTGWGSRCLGCLAHSFLGWDFPQDKSDFCIVFALVYKAWFIKSENTTAFAFRPSSRRGEAAFISCCLLPPSPRTANQQKLIDLFVVVFVPLSVKKITLRRVLGHLNSRNAALPWLHAATRLIGFQHGYVL